MLTVSPVSWNYGGAQPSGELVEKKTDGEVSVQSKRGNTIKRKGDAENPAVHVARSGNDVVKKQSELNVEEKGDGAEDKKEEATNGDVADDERAAGEPKTGVKRAAEDEPEGEEAPKKAKGQRGRPKKATKAAVPKKAAAAKKTVAADSGEKKPRGRPKKEAGTGSSGTPKAKKEKKEKPAPNGTGVGRRTRSSRM